MSLLPKHYSLVCAVIERDGRIFCVQRPDRGHPATALKWEFPGGKIEPGETPLEALKREFAEELKVDINNNAVEEMTKTTFSYPDFTVTLHFFLVSSDDFNFTLTEHIDYLWLDTNELDSIDWAEADKEIVNKLETFYD